MADKKSWINIQADTELVVMLDQMVYEAEMETDHLKYIRGLIRKEYARLHPLRIHPEGATTHSLRICNATPSLLGVRHPVDSSSLPEME